MMNLLIAVLLLSQAPEPPTHKAATLRTVHVGAIDTSSSVQPGQPLAVRRDCISIEIEPRPVAGQRSDRLRLLVTPAAKIVFANPILVDGTRIPKDDAKTVPRDIRDYWIEMPNGQAILIDAVVNKLGVVERIWIYPGTAKN